MSTPPPRRRCRVSQQWVMLCMQWPNERRVRHRSCLAAESGSAIVPAIFVSAFKGKYPLILFYDYHWLQCAQKDIVDDAAGAQLLQGAQFR